MKKLFVALFSALFISGCATVLGNDADITVNSNPEGAEIWLNGEIVGHTPATVSVPGDSAPYLTVKSPGYKTAVIPLETGRNGNTYGNFLWGPFFGIANSIDNLSGNIASFEDGEFNIELEKDSAYD